MRGPERQVVYRTGHQGINLVLFAPVFAVLVQQGHLALGVVGLLIVFATASIPDIDIRLPVVDHRGITHTVWAAAAVGLTVTAPVYYLQNSIATTVPELGGYTPLELGAFVGGSLTFSMLGHIAGDLLTPMGVRPFAPLSGWSVSLDVCPADSWANKLFFGLGVVAISGTIALLGGV